LISLAAFVMSFVIPLGPGSAAPVTLDLGVYWRVGLDLSRVGVGGLASPFGYVYDVYSARMNPTLHAEELLHIRQWEALGPAFPLAYALTGGDPFEPYALTGWQTVPAAQRRGGSYAGTLERMWQPDARRSPQVRVAFGRGETSLSVLPMFGEFLTAAQRPWSGRRTVR
jgi:hypothetical protein